MTQTQTDVPVKVQSVVDGLVARHWQNVTAQEFDGMWNITGTVCHDSWFNAASVQVLMTASRCWGRYFRPALEAQRTSRTWSDFWSWAFVYGERQAREDERNS